MNSQDSLDTQSSHGTNPSERTVQAHESQEGSRKEAAHTYQTMWPSQNEFWKCTTFSGIREEKWMVVTSILVWPLMQPSLQSF